MPSQHVLVTRRIPEPGLAVLVAAGARPTILQPDDEQAVPRTQLLTAVAATDVLLSLLTETVDREVLAVNDTLLGVANMAVGFNNVDVAAATELGIPCSNTPGVLTEATADLAFGLLLAVARHIPQAHAYMVSGRYRIWGPNLFLGADVGAGPNGRAKVLGIIGFGRIGAAMVPRALGFGMQVLAHDPSGRAQIEQTGGVAWAELDQLLARSDFVSLHAPLTPATHHLIDARRLRLMKASAFLINTARGPIVEEAALVEALRTGVIAGAGLDVYEDEPAMTSGLASLDNVVLLPHIASASHETRGAMAQIAATNAIAHLRGQPAPNVVNPQVYATAAYRARRQRAGV